MELHTLGVDGGYTQKDVQEVARCLTGWGIDGETGRFRFYPRRHDDGEKIVLGHPIPAGGGEGDGELVLDILASHPATARFVSRQLCERFVSDNPPAPLVERCAAAWARTNGDLREVVRTIVTSPEFFSRAAYRQKIKSPFEYAVSAVRALGGVIDPSAGSDRQEIALGMIGEKRRAGARFGQMLPGQVALLGEPLFQCQPPTGYGEDSRKWVSSGALIARLNFTIGLSGGRIPGVDLSNSPLLTGGESAAPVLVGQLTSQILHGEVAPSTRATLLRQAEDASDGGSDITAAKRLTALTLGSPEFQRR